MKKQGRKSRGKKSRMFVKSLLQYNVISQTNQISHSRHTLHFLYKED